MSTEIVEKLQKQSIRSLNNLLQNTLAGAEKGVVDQIGAFLSLSQNKDEVVVSFVENLNDFFDELLGKEIIRAETQVDFESLSLVMDEELEVMVALEGMVNSSRNLFLPLFISFNTRLNALFPKTRIDETNNPLDPEQVAEAFSEAIRPLKLDAQNTLALYRAFNQGVLKQLDEIIREGNALLVKCNILPELNMQGTRLSPVKARIKPRPKVDQDTFDGFGSVEPAEPEENAQEELFSVMQNLLHPVTPSSPETGPDSLADGGDTVEPISADSGDTIDLLAGIMSSDEGQSPGSTGAQQPNQQQYAIPASLLSDDGPRTGAVTQAWTPAPGQQVQMVDQQKLMDVLTNIQHRLESQDMLVRKPEITEDGQVLPMEQLDIGESLGELLKDTENEDIVNALDRQSSDIINLVTMLYEAIWQDESVPIPIKELIGRTQITIIKVALSDTMFFDDENHPARALLNEFAAAGIGWTEVEKLEEDPLYHKMQETVHTILVDYDAQEDFFVDQLNDFKTFRTMEAGKTRQLEKRILRAKERNERMDDIHALVTQKIDERILGREIHPFISNMLDTHYHKFMVMLVLKEGPGGNAWRQSINTIDVLLWSIQAHSHEGDRARLETVNPRLLNNLRKAFRISGLDIETIDEVVGQLQEVQQESFGSEEPEFVEEAEQSGLAEDLIDPDMDFKAPEGTEDLIVEDDVTIREPEPAEEVVAAEIPTPESNLEEYLKQVDQFGVGIWVEFIGEDDQSVRCKLAAKINAIDKYIFVNRQGVKVVEKTKQGLAEELRDNTVKIVSDGLLFSRALETVIGNLRDKQTEQQSGSAYQPHSESA